MSPPRGAAAIALAAALLVGASCATTNYPPRVVARGELTLAYQNGFEMHAGGRRIARSLGWNNLPEFVHCVPLAKQHAEGATRDGAAAITLSIFGGLLAGGGVAGLAGGLVEWNTDQRWYWLGGGVASAAVGAIVAGIGRYKKNAANGKAIDAMNFYNDAVGSLGATCDDLTYPAPVAPEPPAPPPDPPTAAPSPP